MSTSSPMHNLQECPRELLTVRSSSQESRAEGAMDKDSADITTERSFTILALCLCFTGSNIPTFFTGPGLRYISDDLNIHDNISWIPNASSLSGACLVLCIGYLQDIAGRRVLLAGGLICMLIGSVIFATANSFGQVISASAILGIGSTVQELGSISAIAELVPARKRGLFLAFPTLLTTCFAPAVLYANVLSEYASWRWLYWISLMWNGVTAILLSLTYFRMKLERSNKQAPLSTVKDIDFLGIGLVVSGVALLLVALQAGGRTHAWISAYVLTQLILGIALLCTFFFWEMYGPGRPLMPMRLFHGQRVVALTFLACIAAGANYTTVLNLGPTIIEDVYRLPPVKDGLLALAPSLSLAVGASVGNALLSAFKNRTREILAVASILMATFTAAQAVIKPTDYAPWVTMGSISSLGIGASLIPLTTLVTLACPQDLVGTGVALTIAIRSIGGSLGYAIFYNIYQTERQSNEGMNIGQAESATQAARIVYYASIAFGILAVGASAALPNMKRYMTGAVLASARR